MARRTTNAYYRGSRNNQSTRKGGTKRSTNEQFSKEVNQRLYGNTQGVFGVNQSTLPRVAAASASKGNVPAEIARQTNAQGGRNKLETSPNGNMSAHEYRYRAIRTALGLSAG